MAGGDGYAKGNNQRLKFLYLVKILMEETDDKHGLSMPTIILRLTAKDIAADRKTLYSDLEELRSFGIDVIGEQRGRSYLYHIAARKIELMELKLLVDSVQAAKFITEKNPVYLLRSRRDWQTFMRQSSFSGKFLSADVLNLRTRASTAM